MSYEPEKYKIVKVENINEDIKLIRVKAPINPLPGQFFQVSILGVGECPLASCSYSKNYVDMLVRNVGSVTSQIFKLKVGDKIWIRGPYGRGFPLTRLLDKDLILIAGGTGIAPITSLIEFIEKNRKHFGEIDIYFGFRNQKYILLKDRIKEWKKKFNLSIILDKPEKGWNGKTGYVRDFLQVRNKKNLACLMCGPEIMMETTTKKLNKFGVKNNQIYWSLERRMECGFGVCGRCLLQDVYVCKDGPVFRYDKIKEKLENEGGK